MRPRRASRSVALRCAPGERLRPRTEIDLSFELPDGGELVRVTGVVMFSREFGAYQTSGIRFEGVAPEVRSRIQAMIGGDESRMAFPLRSIIADAAAHGSAGLVLANNHPSGDSTPSAEDCRATRRLASAAEALDCAILDHLVFAGSECTSFRSAGLL